MPFPSSPVALPPRVGSPRHRECVMMPRMNAIQRLDYRFLVIPWLMISLGAAGSQSPDALRMFATGVAVAGTTGLSFLLGNLRGRLDAART